MIFNKIWAFLLISITAHVIVISLVQDKINFFIEPGNTVNVRLVSTVNTTSSVSTIQSASKNVQKNKPNKQESPVNNSPNYQLINKTSPAPLLKTITTSTPPLTTFKVAPIDELVVDELIAEEPIAKKITTPVSNATPPLNDNKTKALQYLQNALSKHFDYPRIAVNKGWQGKVLLGFQLKRNGIIENIYIAKSSGYAILDRAASKSLANIQSIPRTNSGFNYTSSDLQLPVIYQLQEG